ncbi:hypothetical protein B0H14DRAFT_2767016 [Mycena olivaceomarginata]|nr:hypothetical protein B0H14DRAFT_2767016 [Mycena olivaceomarginata]
MAKVTDHDDEAAAAKLWAVYVSEAEKYDKSLVESWKSDMEGLLIFAGLFSAILTAFLVESYKTLTRDSGDLTVHLLAQISQQLALAANGTTLQGSPLPPFTPSTTSIVCNAFWFLSLGFSLACALVATLVQQRAREFLHRADMHSAPLIRARIFSYLYFGLKRFRIHSVVEIIPLLLHASLLFFFCGLVMFLVPVNIIMTGIAAGLLFIVTTVYSGLSLLPLRYPDCPYRTPLSGALWTSLQWLRRLWNRNRGLKTFRQRKHRHTHEAAIESGLGLETHSLSSDKAILHSSLFDQTMLEEMTRTATETSTERSARDYQALVWTMKSLTDEIEFEPFVEAIPDVLWGLHQRRHAYEKHMQGLMQDSEIQLHNRIASLLASCDTGLLSSEHSTRRRIACYKALWALASLAKPTESSEESNMASQSEFATIFEKFRPHNDGLAAPYFTSADIVMFWSMYCGVRGHLITLRKHITVGTSGNPDLSQVLASVHTIFAKFSSMVRPPSLPKPEATILELREMIDSWLSNGPYMILFEYVTRSASSQALPYRWPETLSVISVDRSVHFSAYQNEYERCLFWLLRQKNTEPSRELVSVLLSHWRPDSDAVPIPRALIKFLNHWPQGYLPSVLLSGGEISTYLWSNFPATISDSEEHESSLEETLTALLQLSHVAVIPISVKHVTQLESLLALVTSGSTSSHLCSSIVALIKWRMTYALGLDATTREIFSVLNNRILPEETAITLPNEILAKEADSISPAEWNTLSRCLGCRRDEARINIMAEFLENCSSLDSDQSRETMQRMDAFVRLFGPFGPPVSFTTPIRSGWQRAYIACTPPTRRPVRCTPFSKAGCGLSTQKGLKPQRRSTDIAQNTLGKNLRACGPG